MQFASVAHQFVKANRSFRISSSTNSRKQQIRTLAMKASWEGVVLAESDDTIVLENNHYFPPSSVKVSEYFKDSPTKTTCGWKGVASYYTVEVNGKTNKDCAWYYPDCKEKAKNIEGYVAFWKGVKVEN